MEDIGCKDHSERTLKRTEGDMSLFKHDSDRDLYNACQTSLYLYKHGKSTIQEVLYYHFQRITILSENNEETFLALLNLGYLHSFKYFIKAALKFSCRAGEAYYKCYKMTQDTKYLKLAYINRKVKNSYLTRNSSFLSKIENEYKHLI